jgi:pimeloyl-ACP methyl ester carboxylesterase
LKRAILVVFAAAAAVLAVLVLSPEPAPGPTGAWLTAAGLEPAFDTVRGRRIRYVRAGSGPTVVLLHGLASSLYTWKDVVPGLARSHDVIALDFPGFGGSEQPSDLDADELPGIVVGLLDRLGLARTALVGNSLGGAVAVSAAATHGERVSALVLLDSAGFNFAESDRPWILRLVGSPVGKALKYLPARRRLVRAGLAQVFHDPALITEERVNEYLAPLMRPGAMTAMRTLLLARGSQAARFREQLSAVRAPTLVIWGREDRWIPVAHADLFAAAIPGARMVVIDGCGHVPQEERPRDVLRLLEEFLS